MLSIINMLFVPLIVLEWRYGMRWRAERRARLARKKEKEEEHARVKGRALESKHEGAKDASSD